jgi:hypothetical protein
MSGLDAHASAAPTIIVTNVISAWCKNGLQPFVYGGLLKLPMAIIVYCSSAQPVLRALQPASSF